MGPSDGQLVGEEEHVIGINLYFEHELRQMLNTTGFRDVSIEGPYTGRPAEPADKTIVIVARRVTLQQ
jgi:hypothetical protein